MIRGNAQRYFKGLGQILLGDAKSKSKHLNCLSMLLQISELSALMVNCCDNYPQCGVITGYQGHEGLVNGWVPDRRSRWTPKWFTDKAPGLKRVLYYE